MSFFSWLWVCGIRIKVRYPRALATTARPIPVFPAVASSTRPPGFNSPRFSASRIIHLPARSFTDWPGFMNSALPRMVQPVISEARVSLINGVLPIASTTSLLMVMCLNRRFLPDHSATLEPFPFRWNRNGALDSCFDAFSSREPVTTSLENALTAGPGDQPAPRRNSAPLAGPSDSDPVPASLALQCEGGALRVRASEDPDALGQFERSLQDAATGKLHTIHRRIDVVDIEIIEPERDRFRGPFAEHAADRPAAGGEQLIDFRR